MKLNIDKLKWIIVLGFENKVHLERLYEDENYVPEVYEIPNYFSITMENMPNCEIGDKIEMIVKEVGNYTGIVKNISTPKNIQKEFNEDFSKWKNFKKKFDIDGEIEEIMKNSEELVLNSYLLEIDNIKYEG